MPSFEGTVAVVTGGASGIGRATARGVRPGRRPGRDRRSGRAARPSRRPPSWATRPSVVGDVSREGTAAARPSGRPSASTRSAGALAGQLRGHLPRQAAEDATGGDWDTSPRRQRQGIGADGRRGRAADPGGRRRRDRQRRLDLGLDRPAEPLDLQRDQGRDPGADPLPGARPGAGTGSGSTSVSPGTIWTPELDRMTGGDRASWEPIFGPHHMLNRVGEPGEVASAILFLCSPTRPASSPATTCASTAATSPWATTSPRARSTTRSSKGACVSTLIRCAGLVDGTGRAPLLDAAIRIEGGRVEAVGPSGRAARPAGRAARRARLRRLLGHARPDRRAHPPRPGRRRAHLRGDGRGPGRDDGAGRRAATCAGTWRAGVTTLRDNGARNMVGFMLREGVARGYLPGPRLLVCGRPITCTGGHFHWCNEDGRRRGRDPQGGPPARPRGRRPHQGHGLRRRHARDDPRPRLLLDRRAARRRRRGPRSSAG